MYSMHCILHCRSMALRMLNDRATSLAKVFLTDYNREYRETRFAPYTVH